MEPEEDRQAILRRRSRRAAAGGFLIQTALAGAGLGALLAGCEPEEAKPCLSIKAPPKSKVDPQPCLEVAPPKPPTKTGAKLKTAGEPDVCLSVPPKPTTQAKVCLRLAPPKKSGPQVCLSIERRKDP